MNTILARLGDVPVTGLHMLLGAAGLALALMGLIALSVSRANRQRAFEAVAAAERQRELDEKLAELGALNAQITGRLQSMAEAVGARQSDLARHLAERLDAVTHRVGQGLESGARATGEQLSRLNERLAVIDAAQTRLSGLAEEVVGLRDILANKQARGAFGQGRMEAIVRDGLPAGAYEFQFTLTNRNRPDCVIRLPGDDRLMVIDAKFPLESFAMLRNAQEAGQRAAAAQRIRGDLGKHIKDIAERYFVPGETQDVAMMFVPSESLYADLNESFEDVVQKAHRARIVIVSPSLLMLAIQVMQSIVRDARMRDQAHLIQKEVRLLLADVRRLQERAGRLETHFRQAQEDVGAIATSAEKIGRRGERIDQMEFAELPAAIAEASAAE
jgi:DNA recombination protein RmuC